MARYALIVGISEYKSKHLASLSKAVGDAKAIAAQLRQDENLTIEPILLTGSVTTKHLTSALAKFARTATGQDAIIYFTGHGFSTTDSLGVTRGYLATYDCGVKKPMGKLITDQEGAISFSSLSQWVEDAHFSSLVMMIDTCHSGDFINYTTYNKGFSSTQEREDYIIIAACHANRESFVRTSDDHSLFTGAVLKALQPDKRDEKGSITSGRLFDDISTTLTGSRQEPFWYGHGRKLQIMQYSPVESPPQLDEIAHPSRSLVPLQMPPLPRHFVERSDHQDPVKECLLREDGKGTGTLVVSAIYGLGGVGKSVLASKLAHDIDVQTRFSDGILWVTLGQNPDLLPLLSGWIQALGDYDYQPTAIQSASNHLRTLMFSKRILLVVDDVWNPSHLEPFRVGGDESCVLVTTREAKISDAKRYDLDVMNTSQSIELMTRKLSVTLDAKARGQAEAFAKRVGYLPLALELAASQIAEGVTWQELLDDLNEEVARLESLNVYGPGDNLSEGQQRQYSLLACFNLSLKQLSDEQRRQFAWLGIIPEDVSLTEAMAETLWQVTSRQARVILRRFKSKALVLAGAQQAEGRPSYRMHDLMHDLAQRLLTSPLQPQNEGELPGLGMTKVDAHSQLLERYQKKTCRGQWHTLKDDGYIYAHLTWHMEQAAQPQAIYQLIKASNEFGRNGWYEAFDAIGKPAGFVNDVGRAWQSAVDECKQDVRSGISKLLRYAFIRTSLNSLASNIPVELVEALVKKKVWQPAQGLSYAQQTQNPWQRALFISAIVPYLSEALLPEVLKTVGQIEDAVYRSYVLSKLAERFPNIWPDALVVIKQIKDRHGSYRGRAQGFPCRSIALCSVVKSLPTQYIFQALSIARQIKADFDQAISVIELSQHLPELWLEAIEITQRIQNESDRAFALSALAKHLPKELLSEALEITRQIQNESDRAFALGALVEHLPKELLSEVLEAVHPIQAEPAQVSILSALAKHLPKELLSEALEITRQIQNETSRFFALSALAKHLSGELLSEALKITRQIQSESNRSSALSVLSKHLPEELLSEVLEAMLQIQSDSNRASSLSVLAERLPEELLPEALKSVRQIQDESSRLSALSTLASRLSELWPEALKVACQIQDESSRSSALSALVPSLPEELLPEALEAVLQIQNASARASSLSMLAKRLPKLWLAVLEAVRQIQDKSAQLLALSMLAPRLPDELLSEALDITRQIQDKSVRLSALSMLASRLPKELLSEALDITRQIQDESTQSSVLSEISKHFPELWPAALDVTRQIQNESTQSSALSAFAEHLPRELLSEALEITRQIQNESAQSSALSSLVPFLPKESLSEVLDITHQIQDDSSQLLVSSEISKRCPELYSEVLEEVRQIRDESVQISILSKIAEPLPTELLSEALDITRQIQDKSVRLVALKALASRLPKLWLEILEIKCQLKPSLDPSSLINLLVNTIRHTFISGQLTRSSDLSEIAKHLPKELLPEALEIVCQNQDESDRSLTLSEVAKYLPEELLPEALETARQIQNKSDRVLVLRTLASRLPILWSEALEAACQIQSESDRSSALSEVAKYLPEELLPVVLEAACQIQSESDRSSALSEVAKYLPEELLPVVLEAACQIQSESDRSSALSEVAKYLPEELLPVVLEAAHQLQDKSARVSVLRTLASRLPMLWSEVLEAICQIQSESDRSSALSEVAKYLPEELLLEALETARQIQDELSMSSALSEIAKHLPEELLLEALETAHQIQDKSARVSVLRTLAPCLPTLWIEVLEIEHQIQDKSALSSALSDIAEHLPEKLLPEALGGMHQARDKYHYASALQSLLLQFKNPPISFIQWIELLDILSCRYRTDLLRLLPVHVNMVLKFGGCETFPEVVKSVQDVCKQWP
ncbi:MAG: NB-ARC domain-containing protein [Cyanobacteria bacterium P01_D01_bin.1]